MPAYVPPVHVMDCRVFLRRFDLFGPVFREENFGRDARD
ncbi:hypothetical protein LptCag_2614 [Leptospirillum ferriphilum]|uniref:Uncharacterized protein n=1 Tax=Leptospirillum ferriphilum TaxID=178606 RepID=A0A094WF68_9BACT|nr:hypothetical protein LptCag_2614 [Leptospirillum ferriphilum]